MITHPALLNLSVHIENNLEDSLSLPEIAEMMQLSPFHFHRKFHHYIGEPLHQQIKRMRIERALWELAQPTSRSIKAIGLTSGYQTLSAFSHAFTVHTGNPPSVYRSTLAAAQRQQARKALQRKLPEQLLRIQPKQIANQKERRTVFLRTVGAGRPAVAETQAIMGKTREITGTNHDEWITTLVDIPGITAAARFRLDTGISATGLSAKIKSQFGLRNLSAGRFAIFDVDCRYSDLVDVALAINLFWIPESGEHLRAAPAYASFQGESVNSEVSFKYYLPLV